nr:E3 ubiquitin ligase BIG BROTHER-like [Ipomoea batatas]GME20378.1 E3 ubiquitin ligase BIG BROTHER-like [Ipomoea batatas]
MSNAELNIHYSTDGIPPEINLKELFPEDGDLSYEEVLQQQETVYLSLQACWKKEDALGEHGQTSNGSQVSAPEDESSHGESIASQLALDEALARSLELGDDLENLCTHQDHDTVAGNEESTHGETPTMAESSNPREDDVDPDNMSYEELRSLGEAVGHECKGLSDDVISQLPTFKYKIGFFSKKQKDECVICYVEYTYGDGLMTLPCAHKYHTKCITRWLKESKNCPLCYEEVQAE